MGNCASPQYKEKVAGGGLNRTSPAKIVHIDGRLQEFREPIKASNVLSLNPNSFLCSSESMYIDRRLPQVPDLFPHATIQVKNPVIPARIMRPC
jgi:hypothetical protein